MSGFQLPIANYQLPIELDLPPCESAIGNRQSRMGGAGRRIRLFTSVATGGAGLMREVRDQGLILRRPSQRVGGTSFGPTKHFVLHALVVFPDDVFWLGFDRIDEHGGALKVFDQPARAQRRQILDEQLIKALGFPGVAALMKQQEILPQFDVRGLICNELPHHHDGAEQQDGDRENQALVAPQESHGVIFTPKTPASQLD
jgi:hypothetical protein